MRTATVENGKNTGIKLAHLAAKAAEGKVIAEDLVDIGKRKAQRFVRQGYEIGEDYLDESRRYIKHNPGSRCAWPSASASHWVSSRDS